MLDLIKKEISSFTNVLLIGLIAVIVFFAFYIEDEVGLLRSTIIDGNASIEDIGRTVKELDSTTKAVIAELTFEDRLARKFADSSVISFHYVNEEELKSLYNGLFREPTIESLINEIVSESNAQIGTGVGEVIKGEIGSQAISKWIREIKVPDLPLNEMFVRFQRLSIERGEVTVGLEHAQLDYQEIEEFDEALQALKGFSFEVDNVNAEEHKKFMMGKAANDAIEALENAKGWVLIEGTFKIEENDDDYFKITFQHPINQFYGDESNYNFLISVLIPKEDITPNVLGYYSSSLGEEVPLRVYGNVWQTVDRDLEKYEMKIRPLAVY